MDTTAQKKLGRTRRHKRVRSTIFGNAKRPRLAVFKSNRFLYVQLIDDGKGVTLGATNTKESKKKTAQERAKEMGAKIAEIAKQKKIKEVIFDRGGFLYAGNIKLFADGAREAGLIF